MTPDLFHSSRSPHRASPSSAFDTRTPRGLGLLGVTLVGVAFGSATLLDLTRHAEAKPRGDVLLADRFSGDAPSAGWSFDRADVWKQSQGRLRATLPDGKQQKSLAFSGSASWRDYAIDLDVCGLRGVDKGVAVRAGDDAGVGIDLRGEGYDDVVMYRGYKELGRASAPNANGRWHHLRVEVHGPRYRVFVNGGLKIEYLDPDPGRDSGRIALAAYTGGSGECDVLYDNVVVRALQ